MNFPKVSVVIPTYNRAKRIRGTILSAMNSIYPNLEIIVSDDGSTDNTIDICRELIDTNNDDDHSPNITLLTNPHKGCYAANNRGIKAASGEYVMILDAGDTITETYITNALQFIEKNEGYDVYYRFVYEQLDFSDEFQLTLVRKIFEDGGSTGLPHSGTFFRKDMFERFGYYDETWESRQDTVYLIKNIENIRIKQLSNILGCNLSDTRIDMDSLSTNEALRGKNIARMLIWMIEEIDHKLLCPNAVSDGEFALAAAMAFNKGSISPGDGDPMKHEKAFKQYVNHYYRFKNVNITKNAPLKIALLTYHDWAAAGYQITEAVKHVSNHEITLIAGMDAYKQFKRPIKDYLRPGISNEENEALAKAVKEADILHFKGDEPPSVAANAFEGASGISLDLTKPTVLTLEGSRFRRNCRIPECSLPQWANLQYLVEADLITTVTADLNYPEIEAKFVQHPFPTKQCTRTWKKREVPLICHAPSNRKKKGTEDIFLPAIEIASEKVNFNVAIIEESPNEFVLEKNSEATLSFDQCAIGWYGIAGIEAMMFGVPLIAWISDQALEQSGWKTTRPIVSFKPTPESLAEVIIRLLTETDLETLSRDTKQFCDHFHSYETVGNIWKTLYEEML